MAQNFSTNTLRLTRQLVTASGNNLYVNSILAGTGIFSLVSDLNNTGIYLYNNIYNTGQLIEGQVNSLSGYSNNTFATIGNLYASGSTLYSYITGLSGSNSSFATIVQLNSLSGFVVNQSGYNVNNYATISNLTNTGVAIENQITTLSGFTTGSSGFLQSEINTTNNNVNIVQLNANTIGQIISGNLTQTGITLYNDILGLSGIVTGISGLDGTKFAPAIANYVYQTGNQAVTGVKTFQQLSFDSAWPINLGGINSPVAQNNSLLFGQSSPFFFNGVQNTGIFYSQFILIGNLNSGAFTGGNTIIGHANSGIFSGYNTGLNGFPTLTTIVGNLNYVDVSSGTFISYNNNIFGDQNVYSGHHSNSSITIIGSANIVDTTSGSNNDVIVGVSNTLLESSAGDSANGPNIIIGNSNTIDNHYDVNAIFGVNTLFGQVLKLYSGANGFMLGVNNTSINDSQVYLFGFNVNSNSSTGSLNIGYNNNIIGANNLMVFGQGIGSTNDSNGVIIGQNSTQFKLIDLSGYFLSITGCYVNSGVSSIAQLKALSGNFSPLLNNIVYQTGNQIITGQKTFQQAILFDTGRSIILGSINNGPFPTGTTSPNLLLIGNGNSGNFTGTQFAGQTNQIIGNGNNFYSTGSTVTLNTILGSSNNLVFNTLVGEAAINTIGENNNIKIISSLEGGNMTVIGDLNSFTHSGSSTASVFGNISILGGNNNINSTSGGNFSVGTTQVLGYFNNISGIYGNVNIVGLNNIINGFITGGNIIGAWNNISNGTGSSIFGDFNTLTNAKYSQIIGENIQLINSTGVLSIGNNNTQIQIISGSGSYLSSDSTGNYSPSGIASVTQLIGLSGNLENQITTLSGFSQNNSNFISNITVTSSYQLTLATPDLIYCNNTTPITINFNGMVAPFSGYSFRIKLLNTGMVSATGSLFDGQPVYNMLTQYSAQEFHSNGTSFYLI